MLLLVGLGNPGSQYTGNRHNIGFMAVDAVARAHRAAPFRARFQGLAAECTVEGEKVVLLKPTTFMNDSGLSVGAAARFFKLEPRDVAVLHDELDLPPGKLRAKAGGGNAGHNGLRSITAHLGNDYRRLRLGIGHPGDKNRVHGFVLDDFGRGERAWVEALCDAVADNVGLLAKRQDAALQNRVHLRMEAAGFADVGLPGK